MTASRIHRIIQAGISAAKTPQGRSQIENILICAAGYAEPGYSDPASGIVALGNWNSVTRYNPATGSFDTIDGTPSRVGRLLERAGAELEWEDEWAICDHCGKAVRTSPDSYQWQRYYAEAEDGITCGDCLKEDPADYLKSLEGKTGSCLTIDLDLEQHGYVRVEGDFEHGCHSGQDADPKLIGKALREQGISRFIFNLDSTSQFDTAFSVWVHSSEIVSLDMAAFAAAPKDGPSVAEGLRRALLDASQKMAALPTIPGYPKVAKCDVGTGTARVRVVTPQEFVEGKALNF